LDVEERVRLIARRPTEEVITFKELRRLLDTKPNPVAYDGFEGSGIPHLGTGLLKVLKVKDLTDAGCRFILFLADWHSMINRKLGGDFERIRDACSLFIEVWKCLMESLNVNTGLVEFKFGSEVYDDEYWVKVLTIAQKVTVRRAFRCLTIAGRRRAEAQSLAMLFYTPMQVADIFKLGVDICQLGVDQRKANILAREVGPELGFWKPVCVHHHLLMGLQEPTRMGLEEDSELDVQVSSKMSKSKPETCIYVVDDPEAVRAKLHKAYCPPKEVENNPIIDICRNVLLRDEGDSLHVDRASKFGGPVTFWSIAELEESYRMGLIHPLDLKNAVADKLIKLLEPCRIHFKSGRLRELLERVRSYTVTR